MGQTETLVTDRQGTERKTKAAASTRGPLIDFGAGRVALSSARIMVGRQRYRTSFAAKLSSSFNGRIASTIGTNGSRVATTSGMSIRRLNGTSRIAPTLETTW